MNIYIYILSFGLCLSLTRHTRGGKDVINGIFYSFNCEQSRNKIYSCPFFVRQGCPMSIMLFGLYLDPFCLSIIPSQQRHAIRLHATEVKVLAYADNIVGSCKHKKV